MQSRLDFIKKVFINKVFINKAFIKQGLRRKLKANLFAPLQPFGHSAAVFFQQKRAHAKTFAHDAV
jgi:hypothetical protein